MNFPLVEQKFGNYILTGGIQETSNSTVYEAEHENECMKLAIKFIKKQSTTQEQCLKEIEINRSIDCDYILPVDDIIEEVPEEFFCAMVMKKATGLDLLDMILEIKGPLPEPIAVQVAYSGLMALQYLHNIGICHRDVKPENFFLMDSNNVELDIVLADFGHACFFDHGQRMNQAIIGTLIYAAPELILRRDYDESIDIWSLGCTLYLILAYRPPFPQPEKDFNPESVRKSVQCILEGNPSYQGGPWDNISEEAKDFVQSMIQVNPENRASIEQLLFHPWLQMYQIDYGRQAERRRKMDEFYKIPPGQQKRTDDYYE